MSIDPAPVLVTGATGQQGGATARALLAAGVPVRALVRDPATDRAVAIQALGAELITGDLNDRDSVIRAAEGARAVFSVQMPPLTAAGFDFEGELAQAVNLVEGARAAGVRQFVHTSFSGAGRHTEAPGRAEGRWSPLEPVYAAKAGAQDLVREAGFTHWTIIKPAFFMENFLPSVAYLLPRGLEGGIVTVLKPATRLSLVAVRDIGTTAAAAFAEPGRFHEVELELAGDYLPMTDIARILSGAFGTELAAPDMTTEEAVEAGMPGPGVLAHEFLNVVGQPARPEYARAFGIPLTTLEDWAGDLVRV
ncbi:NmrA family NAD(P)-binding protein [Nonomuraea sp. NPDC049709]|uniref:NmrA family NAD(P)-binding protein n=1 Tax=Nonomuraea sp. NPDC049709 TaxID=3154736 RepID=UPI00343FEC3F